MNYPKVLIADIETSYLMALTFSLWPDSIPPANVVEDWRIHCAAWKWVGKPRVYGAVETSRCDKKVVEKLCAAIAEADYVVFHNGDKFDMKKLGARVLRHGLPPLAPVKTIDTLKETRRILKDTSHRLDSLGRYWGVGHKLANPTGLWRDCFFGDRKALKTMFTYNKQDVILLEDVYNVLVPHIKNAPNMNLFNDTLNNCPKCGSDSFQKRGKSIATTTIKQRYQCNDCKSWFQSTKMMDKAEVRS